MHIFESGPKTVLNYTAALDLVASMNHGNCWVHNLNVKDGAKMAHDVEMPVDG